MEESEARVATDAELNSGFKRARSILDYAVSTKPIKRPRNYEREDKICTENVDPLQGNVTGNGRFDSTIDALILNKGLPGVITLHTPLDVQAFTARVTSYNVLFWTGKPNVLSAFECARYGWTCMGPNRITCVACRETMVVAEDAPNCFLTRTSWVNEVANKIKISGHGRKCIWTKHHSPLDILQLPFGYDMRKYLTTAAESFRHMPTGLLFAEHYDKIVKQIDLNGLKEKSGLEFNSELQESRKIEIEEASLFLMIHGWSYGRGDAVACGLCHRKLPLCMFKRTSFFEAGNCCPISLPPLTAYKYGGPKRFDPVSNHWTWCPWVIALQPAQRSKKVDEFIRTYSAATDFYNEESAQTEAELKPCIDQYIALASKIDEDFKAEKIFMKSTPEKCPDGVLADAIQTFKSGGWLPIDALISTPDPETSGSSKSTSPNCSMEVLENNGIMSCKPMHGLSRSPFVDDKPESESAYSGSEESFEGDLIENGDELVDPNVSWKKLPVVPFEYQKELKNCTVVLDTN